MADINISQGESVPMTMHTKYEDMGDGTHALVVSVGGTITVIGGLTDAQLRATPVPVSGPLTDTELRAVAVPISGTVAATGPLTDVELRAVAVPVSGPLTDAEVRATALDVDVETLPKPAGAPIVGQVAVGVTGTAIVIGTTLVLPGGTVIVSAHSGNAAAGTVGGSGVTNTQDGSGNGYILEAGKSVVITAANLADVFVNGTAADIFSYAAG